MYREDAQHSIQNINGTTTDINICPDCDGKTEDEYVDFCSHDCLTKYDQCWPYCQSLFNVYGNYFKDYSEENYGETPEFNCELDFSYYNQKK